MVLTVASILCGISAASYLAAQFAPRRNSFHQTTVAASALQVKLSEFQTNGGHSVAQSSHSMVASRTPLLSAPTNPPRASAPATLLKVPAATEQTDRKSGVMTAHREHVETTSAERSVSSSESEGHSVPHFYAPVTVNPVFVNIDNAGIIREISRVHERLDLLSAEAQAAKSAAALDEAVVTAPVQHSEAQPHENSSQKRVHDEQTNDTSPRNHTEPDCPLLLVTEPQPSPETRPVPTVLPTTPQSPTTPLVPPSIPVAEVEFAVPTAPLRVTLLPISVSASDPAAAVAVAPPSASVPEPMPEIQFEMTPRHPVPDIPIFERPATEPEAVEPEAFEPEDMQFEELKFEAVTVEDLKFEDLKFEAVEADALEPEAVEPDALEPDALEPEDLTPDAVKFEDLKFEDLKLDAVQPEAVQPEAVQPEAVEPEAVEPEAVEPASLPVIEFSTEVFAIPEPSNILGKAPPNDVPFLPIPASDFLEPIAFNAPPVPVQWPVLPGVTTLAVPSSQSAKRTTDPPFMNSGSRRVPAPPAQVANEPIGAMRRVSHTSRSSGKHTNQSDGKKSTVAKQAGNPTYRIQAITPSQAFHRIKSALSH